MLPFNKINNLKGHINDRRQTHTGSSTVSTVQTTKRWILGTQ